MGKLRPALLLICLLAAAAVWSPARATWIVNGNQIDDAGHDPVLCTDGAGGAILAWWYGTSGMSLDPEIYMERIGVAGDLLWGYTNLTDDNDDQYHPVIIADGAGGAMVAWEDYRLSASASIYVQRMDTDGAYQWVNHGQYINHGANGPQLALYDTGLALITWEEHATYPTSIGAQKMGGGGVFQWPGEGGNEYITVATGGRSRIAHDGAGGMLVAAENGVGLHVASDGTEDWAWALLADGFTSDEVEVVADGAGGGIFVWPGVTAQRKSAAGARLWGNSGVAVLPDGHDIQVIPDGAGGILVVAATSGDDIRLNRIAANGSYEWGPLGEEVCGSAGVQEAPQLAPDGHGGAYVVWQDQRNDFTTGIDIYAQHVNAAGDVQWATGGVAICTATGDQFNVRIAATGTQSAIIAWEDARESTISTDIYAQAIHYDGSIGDPPFEVTSSNPSPNELDEIRTRTISVKFNLDVDPATLARENILVHGSLTGLHGGILGPRGADGLSFDPSRNFDHGEVVTVSLNDGFASVGGDPLAPFCWSFTVETEGYDGGFLGATQYAVETRPWDACAADMNDDGDMDLLVVNYDSATISFLEGNGDGTFGTQDSTPAQDGPRGVIAIDVNKDGDLDAVTANYVGDNVTIFHNDGSGTFTARSHYAAGNGPTSVCAGDFDNDGDLDLATSNLGDDEMGILVNSGGVFSAGPTYACGDNPIFITCGDLNGDGWVDLATANLLSDDISIFLNTTTGTFAPRVDIAAGNGANMIRAADLDADGDLDLVVSAGTADHLAVFLNDGSGEFAAPVLYDGYVFPNAGFPTDVDGDGDLDLIYSNTGTETVCVRLNDGNGAFGNHSFYFTDLDPLTVVSADFDGDGAMDLATPNRYGHNVTILLNNLALSGVEDDVPGITALLGNAPNPFNPETKITYSLKAAGHVRMTVHDARGVLVATLVDIRQDAGERFATWDGRTVDGRRASSGVYFARLVTEAGKETRKMTLLK